MWMLDTTEILKKMKCLYEKNYKAVINEYLVDLTFETILTYYSGSCAVIVEVKSLQEAYANTDFCLMLECSESELQKLDDHTMDLIITKRILEKHKAIFELNKVLCSKKISRKIIIKNTSFNEPVISIKLDGDAIYLDLNYSKLEHQKSDNQDMYFILKCLCGNFENL